VDRTCGGSAALTALTAETSLPEPRFAAQVSFTRKEHPNMLARWPIYERVLVNLTDGSAINGLLIARRGPLLVLSDATLLTAGMEPAELDGEIYIERARVLFIQAVPS
jgi:hypothetical protein